MIVMSLTLSSEDSESELEDELSGINLLAIELGAFHIIREYSINEAKSSSLIEESKQESAMIDKGLV